MRTKPAICSLVSMNGPSVVVALPFPHADENRAVAALDGLGVDQMAPGLRSSS